MKLIVEKDSNVLVEITSTAEVHMGGLKTDSTTYLTPEALDTVDIESIPKEIEPYKYCYTVEDGFYNNSNYEEPIEVNTKIKSLEREIIGLQMALAEITLMIGGVENEI